MRIAVLTSGILPVPAVLGGAVENLIDFYLEYNNLHHLHDITVFSAYHPSVKKNHALHSRSNHYKYINTNSILYRIEKFLFRHFFPKGYYHSSLEVFFELIAHQLRKEPFDLILLENRPAFALKLRKIFPDTPIVTHLHTNLVHIKECKAKEIICSTNAFIAVSEYIRREIETVGLPTKTYVVYNGIDNKIFNVDVPPIDRHQFDFSDDDFIAIFTGRIIKDKGIKELLLAFKLLQKEKDIKLLIVGSEEFSKRKEHSEFYKELLKITKGIEKSVFFTGFVPYNKLPRYLAAANVMIVPSHINEAFGMTCIEASAMGLPIIATNDGGIPEALRGQKYILLDKEKDLPSQLANSILEIKNNYKQYSGNILNSNFTSISYSKLFFKSLDIIVNEYEHC